MLHFRGEGTLWLHRIQNMAGPAILSHRSFERLVYQGPASLFDTYSGAYLRTGGQAAIITTTADAEAHFNRDRFVSTDSGLPGTAILLRSF